MREPKIEEFTGRTEDGRMWRIELVTEFRNGHEGPMIIRTYIAGKPVILDRRGKGQYWCVDFDEVYGFDGFMILCDDPSAP